ncbi:MAG: hypothetical protein GPJ54_01355 [Candidatus Heimdallarchaeota archaeon]|nr:hypothetical protein [Candidatus Heimdallarchaeota archaeon]
MSREHGDGRVRSIYINELYGDEIYSLFVRLKSIFDYKNILNPGMKIAQTPITENLRYDTITNGTDKETLHPVEVLSLSYHGDI